MQHPIDKRLQDLACPVSLFVPITGGLISRTTLTQVLNNGKSLDRNLEDKLIALLDEMNELKNASLIVPDWSDANGIRAQLAARRSINLATKYDENVVRELLGIEG